MTAPEISVTRRIALLTAVPKLLPQKRKRKKQLLYIRSRWSAREESEPVRRRNAV